MDPRKSRILLCGRTGACGTVKEKHGKKTIRIVRRDESATFGQQRLSLITPSINLTGVI